MPEGSYEFHDEMKLPEARELLKERRDHGVDCPVCGQLAKVYKRKLTESMVRVLYELGARNRGWDDWPKSEWVHINAEIPQRARDFSTTAFFKLAEEELSRRPDGGRAGYWRITDEGVHFLKGEIGVAKYALIYDGEVLGYEGKTVTVDDVAPEFDLADLMQGV